MTSAGPPFLSPVFLLSPSHSQVPAYPRAASAHSDRFIEAKQTETLPVPQPGTDWTPARQIKCAMATFAKTGSSPLQLFSSVSAFRVPSRGTLTVTI